MRYPNRASFAFGGTALILLALFSQGCGTDLNHVLFQSLTAAGRSALDIALTDIANGVADAADALASAADGADQGDEDTPDNNGADSGGGDGNDTDNDSTPAADGDGANGRLVFEANGCATCHCDDASGGCALSAPSILDSDAALVGDKLTGVVGHAGGTRELGASELVDLATYLADLAGGGSAPDAAPDQGAAGDPAAGQVLYGASGCATCHCDDASGGCALSAPSILDSDAVLVGDKLTGVVGHAGGTTELGEAGLADLAAYLADLAGGGSAPDAAPDQGAAGDPAAGQVLYGANGCGTCHCDDASGGCALSAPSILRVDGALVTDKLTGAVGHAGGTRELGEAELADLAAYLADLAGVGDPGTTPDQNVDANVASGRVLYESNACGSCHCADGSGGCALSAPAITGASTSMLDDFLRGAAPHAGGKKVLSDGGIASIAAFLAGG